MNNRYILVGATLILAMVALVFTVRVIRPAANIAKVTDESLKTKGPRDAKIQIVEFSDFECPACRQAADYVRQLMTAYPGKIHFTFKHFPLKSHRWSPIAHAAVECAARLDSFWEYHDMLYAYQPEWVASQNPTETFFRFAKDLGFNLDNFSACLEEQSVKDLIRKERLEGESLQLQATPTFFVNGERLVGPVEFKVKAEAIVRKALELTESGTSIINNESSPESLAEVQEKLGFGGLN